MPRSISEWKIPAIGFAALLTCGQAQALGAQPGGWDVLTEAWNTFWGHCSRFDCGRFCHKPLCPSCKKNYCPLHLLADDYGYRPPRWHAFPGTNPTYTPKRKDIGISPDAPPPAPIQGAVNEANELNKASSKGEPEPQVLLVPASYQEVPSFPIAPKGKRDGR